MQEHPIPQDVTGYKFHIVGNMTLKQFAEVGAGVLVAVIIYNTNLLPIVKWPLLVFAVGLGCMMAFVPIEERPLDHWIITFFRRLYSPTKFYWRKEPIVPFAMTAEKRLKKPTDKTVEVDLTPARRQRIKDYLESVRQPAESDPWETEENSRVSDILQTFEQVKVEKVKAKPQRLKPQLTPRVRKLSLSQAPPAQKQVVFKAAAVAKKTKLTNQLPTQPVNQSIEDTIQPTENGAQASPLPVTRELRQAVHDAVAADQSTLPSTPTTEVYAGEQVATDYTPPEKVASTNAKLPFPQKKLPPNSVMGMVLTKDNRLVDRAVITIKDLQGKIVRSLSTNILGQFFTTAPLPNGTYAIAAAKDGLSFPEQKLVLSGTSVDPLELKAV